MALAVRTISAAQHLQWIDARPAVSFLQTPAWGRVKTDWRARSLGWFDGDRLVGAGLVLLRPVPRLRRYFAYLPEGPDLDWAKVAAGEGREWLAPLRAHLAGSGAFAVRIGPQVPSRRWTAPTIKAALASGDSTSLDVVPADRVDPLAGPLVAALVEAGWRPPAPESGFGAAQPRYVFQLPLAGQTEQSLLVGFNQLWRRNIKKADKAGVVVDVGTYDDLPAFHRLYVETAVRDDFTPRPLEYFQRMWAAMTAEAPHRLRLYLARHEGYLVAATTMVRVGTHAWYSYGASASAKREVRGSNAVQWRMMRDALAEGATVYDLRGITATLDPEDPHIGLIQFKLGTGGEAVEYVGEWTLPINPLLYKGFEFYLRRRG